MRKVQRRFWNKVCGVLLAATMLFSAETVFAEENTAAADSFFTVYVGTSGLYMTDGTGKNSSILDNGLSIKQPLISPKGRYVAYIKEDSLIVCNLVTKNKTTFPKDVISYVWMRDGEIIYGTKDGALTYRNLISNQIKTLGDTKYWYTGLISDGNKLYANKIRHLARFGEESWIDQGIVSIDITKNQEDILLSAKKIVENSSESYSPRLAGLSKDGQQMYIWEHYGDAVDGVSFAIYNLKDETLAANKEFQRGAELNKKVGVNLDVTLLEYQDNFDVNPINPELIAFNAGSMREMTYGKSISLLDTSNMNMENLTEETMSAMTPCFTNDGKKILFSGAAALSPFIDAQYQYDKIIKQWNESSHIIYSVDLSAKEITPLTKGPFDFLPMQAKDGTIYFIRKENNIYSLYQIKGTEEIKVAEGINFGSAYANAEYFGHLEPSLIIDFYTGD